MIKKGIQTEQRDDERLIYFKSTKPTSDSAIGSIFAYGWFLLIGISAFTLPIVSLFSKYLLPENMFTGAPLCMEIVSLVFFWAIAFYFISKILLDNIDETIIRLNRNEMVISRKKGPFVKKNSIILQKKYSIKVLENNGKKKNLPALCIKFNQFDGKFMYGYSQQEALNVKNEIEEAIKDLSKKL